MDHCKTNDKDLHLKNSCDVKNHIKFFNQTFAPQNWIKAFFRIPSIYKISTKNINQSVNQSSNIYVIYKVQKVFLKLLVALEIKQSFQPQLSIFCKPSIT